VPDAIEKHFSMFSNYFIKDDAFINDAIVKITKNLKEGSGNTAEYFSNAFWFIEEYLLPKYELTEVDELLDKWAIQSGTFADSQEGKFKFGYLIVKYSYLDKISQNSIQFLKNNIRPTWGKFINLYTDFIKKEVSQEKVIRLISLMADNKKHFWSLKDKLFTAIEIKEMEAWKKAIIKYTPDYEYLANLGSSISESEKQELAQRFSSDINKLPLKFVNPIVDNVKGNTEREQIIVNSIENWMEQEPKIYFKFDEEEKDRFRKYIIVFSELRKNPHSSKQIREWCKPIIEVLLDEHYFYNDLIEELSMFRNCGYNRLFLKNNKFSEIGKNEFISALSSDSEEVFKEYHLFALNLLKETHVDKEHIKSILEGALIKLEEVNQKKSERWHKIEELIEQY
jgi:hypothetical protein